jgi:cytochrome c553
VLPKGLTGEQVHDIMHKWEASLGTQCGTCHKADPNNIGPNGRPRLDFADDSKPEKATARLMFTMTEEINMQFIAKFDNSGVPVSCGTCHHGHLDPEPFVAPPETHGPPQAGEKPPVAH